MARGGGGGDPDRGGNLKKMKKKRLGVGKSASRLPLEKRGEKRTRELENTGNAVVFKSNTQRKADGESFFSFSFSTCRAIHPLSKPPSNKRTKNKTNRAVWLEKHTVAYQKSVLFALISLQCTHIYISNVATDNLDYQTSSLTRFYFLGSD